MFSRPPATAISISPAIICCAAVTIACAPEPQTRFTVIAGTDTGTPPLIAACRAGFILLPAWITLPSITLPTAAASSPSLRKRCRTTTAPRSAAGIVLSDPLNAPIAVRTGLQRTTSGVDMIYLYRRHLALSIDARKDSFAQIVILTLVLVGAVKFP